jgi:hypothetical protein
MENSIIVDHVLEKLGFVNQQFYRLLLIVGISERDRENILNHVSKKIDAPVVNINLDVSRQLLELPEKQRPLNAANILDSIIKSQSKNTFIFKNIELLFNAALKTDPLRLFKNISRIKTLIVGWNGLIKGSSLIYAAPGHPDYKKYLTDDLNIINLHDSK